MPSDAPRHSEIPGEPSADDLVSIIVDSLRLLVDPEGVVELRALKCQAGSYRKPHTRSGFFDGQLIEEMARLAVALSRSVAPGVYLTLNPVHRDLLSRRCNRIDVAESGSLASDANITRRRWLLVDVDPVRIAEVSSTDIEKAAAREKIEAIRSHLQQVGWPAPILADSGNGYHLLYRVDLPVEDGGLIERCLKVMAARVDNAAVKIDTKVFNPSRIVKLYGTMSRKGDSTPERPHRRSRILETPAALIAVPPDLLESLSATAPAVSPVRCASRGSRKTSGIEDRARKYLSTLPTAVSGQGGHSATFHAACVLVLGFGLTPDDAFPLLEEWNRTHCDPPWEEHELRHKLEDADRKEGERGHLLKRNRSEVQYEASRAVATLSGGDGGGWTNSGHGDLPEESDDKPIIDAGNRNLQDATAQAWRAIDRANRPPFLFRYGGSPGRIERDDYAEPIFQVVDDDRMRHLLARSARWIKHVKRGDELVVVDATPPMDVIKDVLATPDMPLPVLTRIVEAPVFAGDGTLQTEPGYQAASRTLYIPHAGFRVPAVSQQPSANEIARARSLFCDDLLVDFPFTNRAERAHALALLLLPFARDLIGGATPLHMFEKPMPGTGATLLVDMLSYPATGRPIPTMTEGRDEDEWRKRLTAKLRNGPQYLLIDNLRRSLDSGAVAAAITSPTWEDRVLGQSTMLRIHVRCAWLATGNNPVVSSEMSRRIIRIRLDAKTDRPWLRKDFKHDLRVWSRQNRSQLVWAALTLIRAWIAAGRPPGTIKLGMFEDWSEVMGGILDVAGIPGFLTNLEEFYDESDAEGSQWRSFVAAWWNEHQVRPAKVADLYGLLGDDITLPLGEGSDQSRKVRLGQMLTQARDRMFDLEIAEGESSRSIRVSLRRGEMKKRAYEWKLEEVGTSGKKKLVSPHGDSPDTHMQTHPLRNLSDGEDLEPAEITHGESGESGESDVIPHAYSVPDMHSQSEGKDSHDSPDSPAAG